MLPSLMVDADYLPKNWSAWSDNVFVLTNVRYVSAHILAADLLSLTLFFFFFFGSFETSLLL